MTTQISQLLKKHPKLIGTDSLDPVVLMEHNFSDIVDDTILETFSTYKCFINECERLQDSPAELKLFTSYYKSILNNVRGKYHRNLTNLRDSLNTNLEQLDALYDEVAKLLEKEGEAQ